MKPELYCITQHILTRAHSSKIAGGKAHRKRWKSAINVMLFAIKMRVTRYPFALANASALVKIQPSFSEFNFSCV